MADRNTHAIDVYCPKCERGYTEQIDVDKAIERITGEEYKISYGVKVYRCNDCGYEFINGIEHNE